jgi:Tol biopolymer transport system component/DNA-binding winged helix-turn-helix (wHTH) protein
MKKTYKFEPFRLDPDKRVLLKDGEPVPLTPKAFDVLEGLVKNHGLIVTREQMMEHVWAGSFVEESNLTVHISALRKALGENPGEHRYIVTVPGCGYLFVADVHEVWDNDSELIVEEHSHERLIIEQLHEDNGTTLSNLVEVVDAKPMPFLLSSALWLKQHWHISAFSLVALCLITTGLIWKLAQLPNRRPETDWRASLKFVPVADTKSDRKEGMNSGRLSSDGSMIVFSASGEGLNLWIRQIGGGQPRQITRGVCHDHSPVWSPNNQRIAFISDRNNQIGIWSVPFLGGEEPTLLKVLEPTATALRGGTGVQYWSKNDKLYFSWNNNIHVLDLTSKEVTQITQFDVASPANRQFCVSPDEEWVAYLDERAGQFDLWRVPVRGGTPMQITNDAAIELRPAWHPDGKRIIYTASDEGRFRICQAYLDGRPPELITFTGGEGYILDISADGSKLLYYELRDASDLWQLDLETNQEHQLTSEMGLEFWPQISPDGKAIVYQALQGERMIWEPSKSVLLVDSVPSGGQPTRLATDVYEVQWSPDSRQIAFLRGQNGRDELFVMRSVGGEERQITTSGVRSGGNSIGPPFNLFCTKDFCWSSDSNHIAFCSKSNGLATLCVTTVEGTDTIKLSASSDPKELFLCPILSPDGNRTAYIAATLASQGPSLWRIRLADSETDELLFQTNDVLRLLGWTASGDKLVIAVAEDHGMNRAFPAEITISRLSVIGHRRQTIARLPAAYLNNLHLSPDGRNISYVSSLDGRDNIGFLPVDGGEEKKLTNNADPKAYYSGLAWSPDGRHIFCGKQASWSLITLIENFR